jgi:hypothetical protein
MRALVWIGAAVLTGSVCFGQSVSIGGIGGGMLTNDLNGPWVTGVSMRYVIGPALNIGLPLGFGLEADAPYRHVSYRTIFIPESPRTSWEFPLPLKKSFALPVVKPFIEGGYAPRVMPGTYASPNVSHGLVIGGGAEFRIGRLCLSPAIRYTHWNNAPAGLVITQGPTINLTQNQADILLGISWKLR